VFSQLGQALQSSNISAAQQSYTTLLQEFQQADGGTGWLASCGRLRCGEFVGLGDLAGELVCTGFLGPKVLPHLVDDHK